MKGDKEMSTWNAVFKKLQNGNDVRGTAIETEQEKITLTPGTAVYIAEAFAEWLASETGKEKKDTVKKGSDRYTERKEGMEREWTILRNTIYSLHLQ